LYLTRRSLCGLNGMPCMMLWRPEAFDCRELTPPETWSGLTPKPSTLGFEPQTFCISEPALEPTEPPLPPIQLSMAHKLRKGVAPTETQRFSARSSEHLRPVSSLGYWISEGPTQAEPYSSTAGMILIIVYTSRFVRVILAQGPC